MYNLPRGYLSSSACDLWESSPASFREKYYEGKDNLRTKYTEFGKSFARDIEENPDKYPHVPKYNLPEFPIKWVIEGVPVLGYIDCFDTVTKSIIEYKTAVNTSKNPWNKVKVQKWDQLPFYVTCIKDMFGTVNQTVKLIVLETENKEICTITDFAGKQFKYCETKLQFTGKEPVVYERHIADWEIEKTKLRIVRIAKEISTDYTDWLIAKSK